MANNVFSGWYKASIYDPATGTVVQLNKLSIENTNWEEEVMTAENTQSLVYGGKRKALTLAFFDDDGVAQLQTWAENNTPVQAVAAGPTNLQWYESVPMRFRKIPRANKRDGLNLYTVEMEFFGVNPNIHTNQNLLAYLGWQDSNSDGKADGYDVLLSAPSFDNATGVQSGEIINSFSSLSVEVVFPISDVDHTFSCVYIIPPTSVRTRFFSFSNIIYTSDSAVNLGLSSGINKSPVSTYKILYSYFIGSIGTYSVKFPASTTNGVVTSEAQLMSY